MTATQFELEPETYAALVDWPKRLANEGPFFRRWFERVGARRVLDVACGTGHHAALFHSWGLDVEGADVEPAMLAYCRAQHGASDMLRWAARSFTGEPPSGQFDAVVCIGNSLALVPDLSVVQQGLNHMLAALRPGGVCLVQVVNLWRLPVGPITWQRQLRLKRPAGDVLLIKGIHRVGDCGYVEFGELRLGPESFSHEFHSTRILGLTDAALRAAAEAAGGCDAACVGTYQDDPYEPPRSADIILTCRRA
jgi:SAM-dependent methyltransferase